MGIITMVAATTNYKDEYIRYTKELLEKTAEQINKSNDAIVVNLDHDTSKIIGKILSAKVEPLEDGEYGLIYTATVFDLIKEIKYNDDILIEFTSIENNDNPFIISKSEKFTVYIDPDDFKSKNEMEEFSNIVKSNFEDIEVIYYLRYSVLPDPTLIFDFGREILNNIDLILVGKYIREKIYERIEDKTLENIETKLEDKISQILKNLKKSNIKENIKCPDRPLNLCFKGDIGVNIEMILKIDPSNLDKIDNFINKDTINEIMIKSNDYKNDFGAVSIQYIITENEWYLNYIMTEDGKIIYSKKGYENLKKHLNNI